MSTVIYTSGTNFTFVYLFMSLQMTRLIKHLTTSCKAAPAHEQGARHIESICHTKHVATECIVNINVLIFSQMGQNSITCSQFSHIHQKNRGLSKGMGTSCKKLI